jgi:hypothetical protein
MFRVSQHTMRLLIVSFSVIAIAVFATLPATAQVSLAIVPVPSGGITRGTVTLTCSTLGLSSKLYGVQYLLDGKPLSLTITTPPYPYSWNSATVWDGSVTIQASAIDSTGNELARSNAAVLRISNKGATASLLSPGTSAPVSGNIPWSVQASAKSGIQVYTFLLDGGPINDLFDSAHHETIFLDTTTLINGPHELFTGVYSKIDQNTGVAMVQNTINVHNARAIAQLQPRWSTIFMRPGASDNISLSAMTTDGALVAAPPSVYISSDPTVVIVNGSGQLTAIRAGSATITAQSGSLTAATTVTVNSSPGLPHFGRDGSLLTDYDSARSLFVRTLFQLNFDDINANPLLGPKLATSGINTITTGLYDNPADSGSPDYSTWLNGWSGYWTNIEASAQRLGVSLLLTGDDVAREPYQLLNSIMNPWSADAIRTTLGWARDSKRVIAIEMVDEVNAMWGDTPQPTDGRWQRLGVPDSAFSSLMKIINSVPGRPLITWPVISGSNTGAVANWMGAPAYADYTSDYWALTDWPAYPTGASLNGFRNSMDPAVLGRLAYVQQNRPTLLLGTLCGSFYTKHVSGSQYQPGRDIPQAPPVPATAVAAQIMYAAEVGAAGIRMYMFDSQDAKHQRSSAPIGTSDLQTGADPFSVGTDRWAAMSAAFNLISQLEPYLLRTPINGINLGPQFVSAARKGPTTTLFMATNFSEAPASVTADLSPYFTQPVKHVNLYRLLGSNETNSDITSAAATLSQTTVTFQPGETLVWVFSAN